MSALERLREHDRALAAIATEDLFHRIAGLAATVCDCPIALVSVVEHDQPRFKGVIGLHASETPRAEAFCSQAARVGGFLVVENALADERFAAA